MESDNYGDVIVHRTKYAPGRTVRKRECLASCESGPCRLRNRSHTAPTVVAPMRPCRDAEDFHSHHAPVRVLPQIKRLDSRRVGDRVIGGALISGRR